MKIMERSCAHVYAYYSF